MASSISFTSPDRTNEHDANAIVIRCSDFRMRERVTSLITERYETADELVSPGGPYAMLREGRLEAMIDDIETLAGLHNVTRLVLIYHLSCGALKAFCGATPETERDVIEAQIDELRDIVAKRLPTFALEVIIVDPAVQIVDR